MKTCRYCGKVIAEQEEICGNCGYNPQTDTMTASFVKKDKESIMRSEKNISSGVKCFAFWGIIIIIFSLGIKYQGKAGDIIWKAKNIILGNKVSKSAPGSEKAKQKKSTRIRDVRFHKVSADKPLGKNRRIEGIFYDPQGKSYVVINGQLISEKESFGKMVVQKINSDSVEVVEDSNLKVLKVNP
jgi:hypothetical protein